LIAVSFGKISTLVEYNHRKRESPLRVPQTQSAFHPRARFCRPSQDQTHRELVYRPLQFHERGQHFIGANDKAFSVAAMRVSNPDCSPFVVESELASLPPFR